MVASRILVSAQALVTVTDPESEPELDKTGTEYLNVDNSKLLWS